MRADINHMHPLFATIRYLQIAVIGYVDADAVINYICKPFLYNTYFIYS
jgi:hypothetical protein